MPVIDIPIPVGTTLIYGAGWGYSLQKDGKPWGEIYPTPKQATNAYLKVFPKTKLTTQKFRTYDSKNQTKMGPRAIRNMGEYFKHNGIK